MLAVKCHAIREILALDPTIVDAGVQAHINA
jgi:hypothetical protein